MPIYEYTCGDCRKDFELLVRSGEEPACPDCGQSSLTRRLSVPAAPATRGSSSSLPMAPPCGRGGCGRPECD